MKRIQKIIRQDQCSEGNMINQISALIHGAIIKSTDISNFVIHTEVLPLNSEELMEEVFKHKRADGQWVYDGVFTDIQQVVERCEERCKKIVVTLYEVGKDIEGQRVEDMKFIVDGSGVEE